MNTFMQKLGVLAATLSTLLSASAYDFEVDGIYYNITDPNAKEVEVTSGPYNGYRGNIVVPSSVSYDDVQYTVASIWELAFSSCGEMTTITIPNSVTSIGNFAFRWCNSLTRIDVDADNQIYSSNDGILYDKSQTRLICCPRGKAGDVIIPSSVTSILAKAFAECRSLTSITIPNSVTTIEDWAFYACSSLTSITIPNSVTTIGNVAFSGCYKLTTISLPSSVTSIEYDAFVGCSGLTSIDVDVENPTYLSIDGVLYDKIHNALMRCPAKKSGRVEIPNFVTTIEDNAFEYCVDMTSITLPSSVAYIYSHAFFACRGLTSFTSLAVLPPRCGDYPFDNIDKQKCTLYVPAESIEAYKQAPKWKDFLLVDAVEAGINSVAAGSADGATEVFNLTGAKVADTLENLPAGIYIVREGSTVRKIAVR